MDTDDEKGVRATDQTGNSAQIQWSTYPSVSQDLSLAASTATSAIATSDIRYPTSNNSIDFYPYIPPSAAAAQTSLYLRLEDVNRGGAMC